MSDLNTLEKQCARAGLKMTGQRKVILSVVEESVDHPSVEDLYARAQNIDSSISMATVYRTLSLLDEMDLLTKHELKEGCARMEVNEDHHHHLIDLETGDVIEFQNERLEQLKEEIARELGYELIDHTLELYGRKIKT